MSDIQLDALTEALDVLPKRCSGPGGVAGVVKDGRIVGARAWGYANLDTGQAMTAATRLPICSISKQFTCMALLGALGDPARFDGRVAEFLPDYRDSLPTMRNLCDMQSGLRDYWALTILQGALAEQEFRRDDALPLIARMKTAHFAPGTQYSYSNCNFRIVSEIIESETCRKLDDLYREHVWQPAGMKTAVLTSDTRHPEDGLVAYEGNDTTGYFPAENAIFWIGDAGISASLNDMLAYECWIDATRDDESSLYRRISVPPGFADGRPAAYGYGLARERIADFEFTGHGGALRGIRAQRLHSREARLSAVVICNHEPDVHGAAAGLIHAALGASGPQPDTVPAVWDGQFLAPNGLRVCIASGRRGATLSYATDPDNLVLAKDGALASASGVRVTRGDEAVTMERPGDNLTVRLAPLEVRDTADGAEIAGRYRSEELEAEMEISWQDGGAYARFTGLLGTGRFERMAPVGPDVWTLVTRRSMDAPPPGDWTLIVERDSAGQVTGFSLGCWLARQIPYRRVRPLDRR
ncbi:D-aminopeptidase [Tropicimonas sp.]|uniref:D-aminopeptidase n=1 Tax=Tropicimonas sp. TaxID=2067044 RepID=UPI003A8862B3